MATKWKKAFKEIYGESPKKGDYQLAPPSVSMEVFGSSSRVEEDCDVVVRRGSAAGAVGMKRAADASPLKLPKKRSRIESSSANFQTSPALLATSSTSSSKFAGMKICTSSESGLIPAANVLAKSPSRILEVSGVVGRITPRKNDVAPLEVGSPCRPLFRNELTLTNALSLVQTASPFKGSLTEGDYEEKENKHAADEIPSSEPQATRKRVTHKKSEGNNFIKLNMRKKCFVRGKVTAEQKRKMKRKSKWRRFASSK